MITYWLTYLRVLLLLKNSSFGPQLRHLWTDEPNRKWTNESSEYTCFARYPIGSPHMCAQPNRINPNMIRESIYNLLHVTKLFFITLRKKIFVHLELNISVDQCEELKERLCTQGRTDTSSKTNQRSCCGSSNLLSDY